MKFGIVVFPGSNCERDCHDATTLVLGQPTEYLWHDETDLNGADCIILPGGFSYGDYLRSGAIARFSPIMAEVQRHADQGGLVIGICNGFQVLTESGLLPGALRRNSGLRFQCDRVAMTVETTDTPFTNAYQPGQTITLPIANGDGSYYADPEVLQQLEDNQQVVFRYAEDVNGSLNRIAGICNAKRNVLGMMPHPERNLWPSEIWTGEGRGVFDSILSASTVGV
ncbi:MAG: phosphoribosylformylglycinamidine synthase subunit PurQ [Candidatus Melainabacteria bacterium]